MKTKNYLDYISDTNIGTILDGEFAGKPSYYLMPEIKEVLIDDKWIPNPGYNLEKIKSEKLLEIESKILDISIKLDKANTLNLQTQIPELTAKLIELNNQKDEINAL